MAEEAGNAISVDDNRAHSNRGSRENKCGDVMPSTERRDCSKKPLHNGSRQKKKLLYLQKIQAHRLTLQKQGKKGQNQEQQETGVWTKKEREKHQIQRQFKRGEESRVSQLDFNNRFHILTKREVGISDSEGTKKKEVEVRKVKENELLREITVKIGLERINTQEGVTVEALLYSNATGLVMSSEFARKQEFKLKKIDRPIYVRNVDGSFN